MGKPPSTWDRMNWHPALPAVFSAYLIFRITKPGWEWTAWNIVWCSTMALWLTGSLINYFTKGKVLEFLDSDGDDDTIEVPKTFAKFEKIAKHKSPLIDSLRAGLADGGDMKGACEEIESEDGITDIDDGMAVLTAYRELCGRDDSSARHVADLMRNAGTEDLFGLFYQCGMPLLHERLTAISGRPLGDYEFDNEELKLLAMLTGFGYAPANDDIVRAARDPRLHASYMWGTIFGAGTPNDEDFVSLLRKCGTELPTAFAGVAFLDRCNEMALEHDFAPHPFSSDAGIARLREYFTDSNPEHFSYATSAATALPFLSHPAAEQLLPLASRHPDPNVSVEGAWAGAKLGNKDSVGLLAVMAQDWRRGERAMNYMRELELAAEIPPDALAPRHVAKCEMASWLQHPNELTKLPDSLEIIDHRRIFWPPVNEPRDVTILRWRLGEESGVGMTGGTTTWCFFGVDHEESNTPIEIYARHCNWQLSAEEIAGAPEDYNDLDHGRGLLVQHNPDEDWAPRP